MSSFPLTNSIIFQRLGLIYMENHHFQWQTVTNYQRVYIYIHTTKQLILSPIFSAFLCAPHEAQQIPERRHDVQLLNDTILSIKVGKKGAIVEDPFPNCWGQWFRNQKKLLGENGKYQKFSRRAMFQRKV